ncbi:MAG TPA: hypothetical protein VKB88_45715 [Bryobacteraceae bacterium]|nr:hypothetical protein [Bryobacteraceae bacterium]
MKRAFTFLILTVATVGWAQDIAGDWQGTLNTGMGELRLVLHITKDADRAFKATLDSVDQGAPGIPIRSITLKDSKLRFDVAAVQGTYEGTMSADGNTIAGTWSQGNPLSLEFKRATAPIKTTHVPAKPSDIDGAWIGTLDTGEGRLRLVFHIMNTVDGLVATMDSPDQRAKGIPASLVTRNGMSLRIQAKGIGGVFQGTVSSDLGTIDGKWTQGGETMALLLKRVKD